MALHAARDVRMARWPRPGRAPRAGSRTRSRPSRARRSRRSPTVGGPRWFQLYTTPDAEWTMSLVDRAEAAGYEALVMTVDCGAARPAGAGPRASGSRCRRASGTRTSSSARETGRRRGRPSREGPQLYAKEFLKEALTPADLAWLVRESPACRSSSRASSVATTRSRRRGTGPPASGCRNHGGRQLDRAVASIDALPDVVAAVRGRVPVLFDSGIRRGMDALIALALGATRGLRRAAAPLGRSRGTASAAPGAVLDMLTSPSSTSRWRSRACRAPRRSTRSILVHADLAHLPRRIR